MAECHHCGETSDLPYKCQYCGGIYCDEDRLPETHECDGVQFLSDPGKRFESKFSDEVGGIDDDVRAPEPVDPAYTVGSQPTPEYESSPDVRLEGTDPDDVHRDGFFARVRRFFGL